MVLIKDETYRDIERGALSSSEETRLSKLGMLVNDKEEEKQELLGLLDRINTNNPVMLITVVLNLSILGKTAFEVIERG